MSLSEEYFVISNDYSKVNFVVNMDDEREFDILMDKAISTSIPVKFKCLNLNTFKNTPVSFDISVDTEILFDEDYSVIFSNLNLYKNSLLPALINENNYLYLHCYNIINIEDDIKGFDFEILGSIPIKNRLIFKPSDASIVVFFHSSVIDKLTSVKPFEYVKYIKVSDWSVEWEMH